MRKRETPDHVWQRCSADFNSPIAGKYYLHVIIDNLSRYPVVQVTKSTKFMDPKPKLEEKFCTFGILESITHDNGAPHFVEEWKGFSWKHGFGSRPVTPAHPERNGLVKRLMGILVKNIKTVEAENKDPKIEIKRRLMNYRNTPHPCIGVALAELMFRSKIRTRIPTLERLLHKSQVEEAKEKDRRTCK